MLVLKFGGSSVANAERLVNVAEIITSKYELNEHIYVVVSAFAGVTDSLIGICQKASENDKTYLDDLEHLLDRIRSIASELLPSESFHEIETNLKDNHVALTSILSGVSLAQEASSKTMDYILSFGERNSAFILSSYLNSRSVPSSYIDARSYIITNDNFGAAAVNFEQTNENIAQLAESSPGVKVVTGFIGSDATSGRTTTLGRGGSDYTAAIFAAALDAEQLEIWTDVNGVLTSNPKLVKKAFSIPEMTYNEALEMSHFGAKVLYAPTIRPVRQSGIPTYIKNTFNPSHPGTRIHNNKASSHATITGLSSIDNISILTLQGTGLQGVAGIASRFFKCLSSGGINIIMITQASSEHSISIAVLSDFVNLAIELVQEEFLYEMNRSLIDPLDISNELSLIAAIGENMKNSPGVSGLLFRTLGRNGINIEAISQGSSELNISFAIKSKNVARALNSIHDAFFLSEYKTVHLFIVGVGLIGSKLLKQIRENIDNIREKAGIEFVINGVSNSKKMFLSDDHILPGDYKKVLEQSDVRADMDMFISGMIDLNLANSIFIDNTASASMPSHYERILKHNIAISTPNKIAMSSSMEHYNNLKQLSKKRQTPIKFETNVAAGLPVMSTIQNLIHSGDTIKKN